MVYRNNTGRLGFWLHQCVLRNTLAGSRTVVSISRNPTVHMITHTHAKWHIHALIVITTARQWTREELMQTQGALHISFVRRNQTTFSTSNARTSLYPPPETPIYPPHPLFPTNQRTVCGPWAGTVLLFYTDPINRAWVYSSEEAPRSFTMAPCVVVERLEGKQRCSRAPVDERAELQAWEWPRWLFTEKRKVNEERPNPTTAHHAITTARHPDNTRSFALVRLREPGAIHPIHGPPKLRAHESMLRNRIHIFAIFPPFDSVSITIAGVFF